MSTKLKQKPQENTQVPKAPDLTDINDALNTARENAEKMKLPQQPKTTKTIPENTLTEARKLAEQFNNLDKKKGTRAVNSILA
ncbi:MAG: hypothetical protein D6769_02335 [Methanobacteriota archaeon]|nr:MAG: hypothetical protein D6769_02335 [Euryarchaeota archaeon]